MKTSIITDGASVSFVVADLDPTYFDIMRGFYYTETEAGFVKTYPADTPGLVAMYKHFSEHVEDIILQAANVVPVPWEQALLALLQRIEGQPVNWWLVGSTALAVRGLDIVPHDIDLCVDDASAHLLGELLADYLIEPVQDASGWICKWFGRAFLHTRIEWVGGVDERLDEQMLSDYGPLAAARKEVIIWHGYEIYVPPLDLQLQVSEQRGLTDRVELIKQTLL